MTPKTTPMIQSCILHFGEMGSRWGINRTVGQMYALLVFSKDPLCADDICEALGCSRSNVSMGLKELLSWELIKLLHLPGDRREFYAAPGSALEIAKILIQQRRKREMDPTMSTMCNLLLVQPANDAEKYAQQRMKDMYELMELIMVWTEQLQSLDKTQLSAMLKLGKNINNVLNIKNKIFGTTSKE
jgi:DNA-binding transcriptional regulator GbsR (MarR family)